MSAARRSYAGLGAVFLVLGVSGCSAAPSDDVEAAALESAVVSAVPGLNGAYVSFSSSGADHSTLLILYVKGDDVTTVARQVDEGFRVAWRSAPFAAADIAVGAVQKKRPAHPTTSEPDSLDPAAIARVLGISTDHATDVWIDLGRDDLVKRYGAWQKPAGS